MCNAAETNWFQSRALQARQAPYCGPANAHRAAFRQPACWRANRNPLSKIAFL